MPNPQAALDPYGVPVRPTYHFMGKLYKAVKTTFSEETRIF